MNGLATAVGYNSVDHLLLHRAFPNVVWWFCLVVVLFVCFILLRFVLFRQQGWRTMLNQAVSFLNSSLWAQTDEVHVVVICRHVLSVAIFSNKQKERRNIYVEKILLGAGTYPLARFITNTRDCAIPQLSRLGNARHSEEKLDRAGKKRIGDQKQEDQKC